MKRLRATFWGLAGVALGLGGVILFWALTPSSIYLQPTGLQVQRDDSGWVVTSGRELPYGDVTADWEIKITVLREDADFVCVRSGRTIYRADVGPVVRYRLTEWAQECLEAGPPLAIRWTRSVRLLWGQLPLRPVTTSVSIRPEDLPVQPNEG